MEIYNLIFADEQTGIDNLDDMARIAWGVMVHGIHDPPVWQIIKARARAAAMVFLAREELK